MSNTNHSFNASDPLNTEVDIPNREKQPPIDLMSKFTNCAGEIGRCLVDRNASALKARHPAPTENDTMVDRACKGLLHAATHLDDSSSSLLRDINKNPGTYVTDWFVQIWHDPSEQSCLPLLEWFDECVKNKNAGILWDLRAMLLKHRDLASALYSNPEEATGHKASYHNLPTDISPEHIQAVYATFELLSVIVLGAREALALRHGVTWRDSLDMQKSTKHTRA